MILACPLESGVGCDVLKEKRLKYVEVAKPASICEKAEMNAQAPAWSCLQAQQLKIIVWAWPLCGCNMQTPRGPCVYVFV